MKYYFFLLFTLFSVFGFSQKSKIDLKAIEKSLKNPDSPYNYDKLIFKYKGYHSTSITEEILEMIKSPFQKTVLKILLMPLKKIILQSV